MKMVYLLTSGEYSDYRVLAVFSTREAAEAARGIHDAERRNLDESRVEEYQLLDEPVRSEVHTHTIMWGRGYSRRDAPAWGSPKAEWGAHGEEVEDLRDSESAGPVIGVSSRALTAERAAKIAHDRAAELKAREAGIA
jgi:hypothetical protein